MTKISIAMTTYNGEQFVEEQLKSLLSQTLQADEVVIFDDNSKDKTADIVTSFINKNELENWFFKVNKMNIGFIENFYQAIKRTTGDIVFLCDQDDVWHSDKVGLIIRAFQENKGMKIINSSFNKIDQFGNPIHSKSIINRANNNIIRGIIKTNSFKKIKLEYILWRNISPGCTIAFNKDCKDMFEKNFTKLIYHDWELNIFGAVLDGLYFYNRELIKYRIHDGNAIGLKKPSLAREKDIMNERLKQIKYAEVDYKRAQIYLNAPWVSKLNKKQKKCLQQFKWMTEKRLAAISEKRLGQWMLIFYNFAGYVKFRGYKGIAEDFLFIVS